MPRKGYKETEVGVIRVEWEAASYHDVVKINMPPIVMDPDEMYSPVIVRRRHNGLEIRETKKGKDILVKNQFRAVPGTLLISKRQIVHGSCGLVPKDIGANAIVSKEYLALQAIAVKLTITYLDYFAQMPMFQDSIVRTTYGVDDEKFVFKDQWWMREKLPLPPLPEQRKIAEILTSVDDTIESTRKVIAQTKKVKQGLLQELLTKGIGHKKLKDTEIGRIPVEWEVVRLVDEIEIMSGQVDPKEEPFCNYILVAPNHIESTTGHLIGKETAKSQTAISGKYLFESGDVIYSKIRPYLCKAFLSSFTGLCSADMYALRPKAKMNSKYLLGIVLSERFTSFANSKSMRTGIPKLNRDELGEYFCALPSLPEQKQIASILSSVDDKITAQETELAQLQKMKKGLMQDLLTGKVRVKVR